MPYDFTTVVDRSRVGASKYVQMQHWNPNVSAGTVPFSVADMEIKTAPEIVDGLKQYLDENILGYAMATPAYLQAVCSWMKRRHQWDIKPEWLVGSPGVVTAFLLGIKAYTKPGDGVIIQTPVYYPFSMGIGFTGRKVVRNPLVLTPDGYRMDFEDLERQASDPNNKMLLFCSPHNPVGRVWTQEELRQVVDICQRHNLLIISDEIHFDLTMPGHTHTVLAKLSKQMADRMMICTAPSKTFNLAGMHTSNIIIPNEDLRKAFSREALSNAIISMNCLGYRACEIAYTRCEAWLEELKALIWHNHTQLKQFMAERLPQIKVFALEGTYLQWMDFRALGIEAKELERRMHMEAEVFFDEGYVFGEEGSGFERMNLACPTHVLMDALERLEKNLKK